MMACCIDSRECCIDRVKTKIAAREATFGNDQTADSPTLSVYETHRQNHAKGGVKVLTRVVHLLFYPPSVPGGVSSMVPTWAQWQQSLLGIPAGIHWSLLAYEARENARRAILYYAKSLADLTFEPGMVLHAHHPLTVLAARQWMIRTRRRSPLVFTVHGIPDPKEECSLNQAMWAADFNIAVSRYVAELLSQGPFSHIDAIVRNGLDAETRFLPRNLPSIERGVRLVSVARIEKEKGFDAVVQVVKELARLHVPMTWTLVGDGALRRDILHQASFEGLGRVMRWAGFDHQPERWLEVSNLFILLSRAEAFGNAFVEANMMGLPTVGTAIGGIPEHLIPGLNGILASRTCLKEVAYAIRDLYRKPRLWTQMHRNAIRQGRLFSIERAIQDYQSVYQWPLVQPRVASD